MDDYEKAFYWFRKDAKRYYKSAYALADLYYFVKGVKQNYKKAEYCCKIGKEDKEWREQDEF